VDRNDGEEASTLKKHCRSHSEEGGRRFVLEVLWLRPLSPPRQRGRFDERLAVPITLIPARRVMARNGKPLIWSMQKDSPSPAAVQVAVLLEGHAPPA
jgi:hypothetical protein